MSTQTLLSEVWQDLPERENDYQQLYRRIAGNESISLDQIGEFYDLYSMKKGFYDKYDGPPPISAVLGHITSEVSEAWKEWYKTSQDEDVGQDFGMELADIIIMTCLLAYQTGIPLDVFVREKTRKNYARTGYCHGKRPKPGEYDPESAQEAP